MSSHAAGQAKIEAYIDRLMVEVRAGRMTLDEAEAEGNKFAQELSKLTLADVPNNEPESIDNPVAAEAALIRKSQQRAADIRLVMEHQGSDLSSYSDSEVVALYEGAMVEQAQRAADHASANSMKDNLAVAGVSTISELDAQIRNPEGATA